MRQGENKIMKIVNRKTTFLEYFLLEQKFSTINEDFHVGVNHKPESRIFFSFLKDIGNRIYEWI